jgi:16S rRNA G966 N2-methylase RsmD
LASRGATDCTIVEKDNKMYDFIKKTYTELAFSNFKLIKMEVFNYIETCSEQYDFIFAGPPYALGTIDDLPLQIIEKKLLKPGGLFVLEHTPRNDYKKFPHYKMERNYGTTIFSIFIG